MRHTQCPDRWNRSAARRVRAGVVLVARAGAAALVGWIAAAGAAGQPCGSEGQRLFPADAETDDRIGQAVAVSADGMTLAVGAPLDHVGSVFDAGSVLIYVKSGSAWVFQGRLTASDLGADDEFGTSVALSADGNTLVAGSPYDNRPGIADGGAAYVFTRTGTAWTEQAKLIGGSTGAYGQHYFGSDVAIAADGDTVAVGAPRWNQGSRGEEGAVYVFTRTGTAWAQAALLRADMGGTGDRLGASVAISSDGSLIAAAASSDDTDVLPSALNVGSVSLFRKAGSAWAPLTKVWAADGEAGDSFGTDVALSGDGSTLAVGMAFDTTPGGAGAGSVRIFTAPGWGQQAALTSADPAHSENFGISVSLSHDGGKLLAGCFGDTVSGQIQAGSVTVFGRSGGAWAGQGKLISGNPMIGDVFGISTAISADGKTIAVGEYKDDTGLIDTGSVWVFGAGCAADLNCDGVADFTDYLEFLNLFDAGDLRVDFTGDGVVDFSDYLEFLNFYDAGC